MNIMKIFILTMAYAVIVTQSTPISVKQFTKKGKSLYNDNSLGTLSALFFKLIPDRTKAGQERLNTSHPIRNTVKPYFTIDSAKPMLFNTAEYNHGDSYTKFSYFINVPVTHAFEKYKMIVVTAPPYIKLGSRDTDPLIVYMVFEDDSTDDSTLPTMPEVYFVTKKNGRIDFSTKQKNDQYWIINSNRTVTGLKSKDVAKFVKFTKKRHEPVPWRSMSPYL